MPRQPRSTRRKKKIVFVLFLLLALLGAAFMGYRFLAGGNPGRDFRERSKAAYEALEGERYGEARILLATLVAENPERLRLRQNLALCLLKLDRPEEAAAVARGTIGISENYAPAHAMLSASLKVLGDLEGAIREARLATRGDKVSENSRLVLAELLIAVGLRTEGIGELVEVVESEDGGESAAVRLAMLMAGRNIEPVAAAKARRGLSDLLETAQAELQASPDETELVGRVARLALASGEPETASAALIAVKVHRPLSDPETVLLATALAATGRIERARELLDALGPIDEETLDGVPLPVAFEERILARIVSGEPKKALAETDRAPAALAGTLFLDSLRLGALERIARTEYGRGGGVGLLAIAADLDATATRILESRPLDEKARESRALARLALGRPGQAVEDAMALEKNSPGLPSGPWLHGLAALDLGFAASALELLTRGAPEPLDSDSARWILKAALLAGDAETVARLTPIIDPAGNGALLAQAALLANDTDRALSLALEDGFLNSPLVERVRVAKTLAALDRPGPAQALAMELEGENNPVVQILRSEVLNGLGRGDEAVAALNAITVEGGEYTLPALMSLAEQAGRRGAEGRADFDAVVLRIRKLPDAEALADILEARMALTEGDARKAVRLGRRALAAQPDNPEGRTVLLQGLIAARADRAEIEEAAERALEVAPAFGPARVVRAMSLLEQGRKELLAGDSSLAAGQLDQAAKLVPGASGPVFYRGVALLGAGDPASVERDVALLRAADDGAVAADFLEGLLRLSQGRLDPAEECFQRVLAGEPEHRDAMAALGLIHLRNEHFEAARTQAEALFALEPGSTRALRLMAAALAFEGKLDRAEAVLRKALEIDPGDVGASLLLARCLFTAKKHEEAVAVSRRLVAERPDTGAAHANLVAALRLSGDTAGALKAAEEAGKREEFRSLSHVLKANVLKADGKPAEALSELRAAVRIDPENVAALELLAQAAIKAGDLDEGRRVLERAARLVPGNVRVRMSLGILAQTLGREGEAKAWYEEVLRLHPDTAPAANNLSYLLAANFATSGRAVDLARRAVAAEPENAEYRDTLAVALSANNRHEEAAEASREAMRLDPENALIALRSAKVFFEGGLKEEAREALEVAREKATPEEQETVEREGRLLR
jgi:tetratricopeptide (TPR) repeat protein